jgi:DNA-directed RNA polymerase specialized sigma subunit
MMDSTSTALPLNMFHEGMMYAIEHIDEVKQIVKAEEKEKRILSAFNKLEIGWNMNWGAKEVAEEAGVTLEEAEDALKRYEI